MKHPLIGIYFAVAQLSQKPKNLSLFQEALGLLKENLNLIPQTEQRELTFLLINCGFLNDSKGNNDYREYLFELYELGVENSFLALDGNISTNTYINAVIVSSATKRFYWAASFMEKYESFLALSTKEYATTLARSYWFFHQEKFEKAVTALRSMGGVGGIGVYSKFWYGIRIRTLLLRTNFELAPHDPFYLKQVRSDIISLRKMIETKGEINPERSSAYMNLIDFIEALCPLIKKAKKDIREELIEMERAVRQAEFLIAKPWLLAKIEALR